MNSFQNILHAKVAKTGPESSPVMDEKTIQFLFEKVVQEQYGVKGRSNVIALSFRKGILTLGIYKSLWQAEVTLTKDDLRESLNKKIGSEMIKSIKIQRK